MRKLVINKILDIFKNHFTYDVIIMKETFLKSRFFAGVNSKFEMRLLAIDSSLLYYFVENLREFFMILSAQTSPACPLIYQTLAAKELKSFDPFDINSLCLLFYEFKLFFSVSVAAFVTGRLESR